MLYLVIVNISPLLIQSYSNKTGFQSLKNNGKLNILKNPFSYALQSLLNFNSEAYYLLFIVQSQGNCYPSTCFLNLYKYISFEISGVDTNFFIFLFLSHTGK